MISIKAPFPMPNSIVRTHHIISILHEMCWSNEGLFSTERLEIFSIQKIRGAFFHQ